MDAGQTSLMEVFLYVAKWLSFFCFLIAALIHVAIFYMEVFLVPQKPHLMKVSPENLPAVRVWSLNQGFYNLFLALGMLAGLACVLLQKREAAGALVGFTGLFMMGAGVVLRFSVPQLRRGFFMQFFPPLFGFLFLSIHIFARIFHLA